MRSTPVNASRAADVARAEDRAYSELSDAFSPISCPTLRAAARRVFEHWTNETGDAMSAEEARDALVAVARYAADRKAGRPEEPADPIAVSVLGRRALDLLRADVVEHWQDLAPTPTADVMLDTLASLEAAREAIQPDWAAYFASRLSGPGGHDLVVEVAHDLRSPLTSILFLAETMQRGQSGEINEVQRRQLGLIYSAALGLSAMASDVIELARGGDRLVDKEPQPFSVMETLESVRDIVRPIAEEKGLSVRLFPPATDHRLGHPLALSRVLLNLTTNALKFTDEGFVEITTRATGLSRLEFSVRDTGRGITPDGLEVLYQPFRRRPGRDAYCFSGTGLGLAICRKLVEVMGSRLEVETRPKWGTRFFFELELAPASHL